MKREQEEQLDEVTEHIAQAKNIISELSENLGTSDNDDNPDDEPEDSGGISEELENILTSLEDLESSLDDLRESLQ